LVKYGNAFDMDAIMKRFIEGENREQSALFPERLDDYIREDNPVRAINVFVDELDLKSLGFEGMEPEETGRPAYHPATLLKLYIYGYLNRIQSSRRLERSADPTFKGNWQEARAGSRPAAVADRPGRALYGHEEPLFADRRL
jgi:Transposase domain (DUF772)